MYGGCPACSVEGKPSNLDVRYDPGELKAAALATHDEVQARGGPASMWSYLRLLPVSADNVTSLGAGATPLLPAPRLGAALGIPNLLLKDESRNPTGSFKDRLAGGAVSAARQLGRQVIVGSSSGNAGAAVAAASARAGMPCVMFTTQKFPLAMKAQMSVYGTYLIAAPTIQDRWSLMEEGVDQLGWFPTTVYGWPFFGSNCYGIEGYKTIGYEIVDQSFHWLAARPHRVPGRRGRRVLRGVQRDRGVRPRLSLSIACLACMPPRCTAPSSARSRRPGTSSVWWRRSRLPDRRLRSPSAPRCRNFPGPRRAAAVRRRRPVAGLTTMRCCVPSSIWGPGPRASGSRHHRRCPSPSCPGFSPRGQIDPVPRPSSRSSPPPVSRTPR